MKSKLMKRLLPLALVLIMAVGMVIPAIAADDNQGDAAQAADPSVTIVEESGLTLLKTTTLQNDGTYNIDLEAYATGEVVTTVTQTPLDIVLLLDISGSMTRAFGTETRYRSYTSDAYDAYNYYRNRLFHQAGDGSFHQVTVESLGNYRYRFSCPTCTDFVPFTNEHWYDDLSSSGLYYSYSVSISRLDALKSSAKSFIDLIAAQVADAVDKGQMSEDAVHRVSIVVFDRTAEVKYTLTDVVGDDVDNMKNTIEGLTTDRGWTSTDLGMQEAGNQFNYADDERGKILVFFTDGQPYAGNGETHNNINFTEQTAIDAIKEAKTIKDNGVSIYTIAINENADENADLNEQTGGRWSEPTAKARFNAFLQGTSSNYPDANDYDIDNPGNAGNLGEKKSSNYYKVATDSVQLNEIFKTISEDAASTSVELTEQAVVKDILSTNFELPEGYDPTSEISVYTVDYLGNDNWADERVPLNDAIVVNNDRVNVTGFNFKENFVHEAGTSGHVVAGGKKLVITIKDVVLVPDPETGEIYSNNEGSGVYENSDAEEPVAEFGRPKVNIYEQSYVLDYGKKTELQGLRINATDVLNVFGKITDRGTNNVAVGTYGTTTLEDGTLYYTPKTTLWDKSEYFAVFGTDKESNKIQWEKIDIIPANNVYYEDTFVTTSDTDGTGARIGIEYTGNGWILAEEGNNVEHDSNEDPSVSGKPYGWIESMDGELTDSDGTVSEANVGNGETASATFSFTGTGVDVYSRTTSTSGTVLAILRGNAKGSETSITKFLIVDNGTEQLDYYQVPTLKFNNLEYGTYTVTIHVTNQAAGRAMYYLDGIRVYNPLGRVEKSTNIVGEDYDMDKELKAVFTTVRDIILENGEFGEDAEAVYVDGQAADADLATYESIGPKSEVYLAKDQKIAFKVKTDEAYTYYLGLKAGQGNTTTASVTNGDNQKVDIAINSSFDQYYKITPDSEGYVVVENIGDGLLSITKLRTTGTGDSGVVATSSNNLVMAARLFANYRIASTVVEPEPETNEEIIETPVEEETETISEDEITIDNPVVEEPTVPVEKPAHNNNKNESKSSFRRIIDQIVGWFRRGR